MSWGAGAATVAVVHKNFSGNKISLGKALNGILGKLVTFFAVSFSAFLICVILETLALCAGLLFFAPFLLFVRPALIIDTLGFVAIAKSLEVARSGYPVAQLSFILVGM